MARPANVAPPLTMAEVASQFERLLVPPIALAVSGGSDSMALLLLAAEWTRSRGAAGEVAPLTAITVDHGLRAESAAEAEFVAAKCASLAIPHTILRWTGPKPTTGLPEAARQARYDLIAEHLAADARAHTGRPQRRLATAHHRDDVAETFLMRLARGSGLDGLAAMAESTTWPPCGGRLPGRPLMTIVRPLLSVPKDHLIATLAARGCGWHEDPTNRDSSF
ncbi:MAG TPA: tRNA lysidine(34) synthetase TilS, partial [Hyphomicrobiaceae bacterium]|nr:tRNA lysidine(34) synthetase TilS [Hyphomicrobiaceae bacterium]